MTLEFAPDPPANCDLCPRLHKFRSDTAQEHPDWYNGAVGSFGDPKARLLIIGLAPGLRGANRTRSPLSQEIMQATFYMKRLAIMVLPQVLTRRTRMMV